MDFFINLLVTATIIYILSQVLSKVYIKNFWTALWVSFVTGILTTIVIAIIGWLFLAIALVNLLTLLLFSYIIPVITLIITAFTLLRIGRITKDFKIEGFKTALIIALAVTLSTAIVGWLRGENDEEYAKLDQKQQTEQVYQQV